jgi:hypothetical protein
MRAGGISMFSRWCIAPSSHPPPGGSDHGKSASLYLYRRAFAFLAISHWRDLIYKMTTRVQDLRQDIDNTAFQTANEVLSLKYHLFANIPD